MKVRVNVLSKITLAIHECLQFGQVQKISLSNKGFKLFFSRFQPNPTSDWILVNQSRVVLLSNLENLRKTTSVPEKDS